MGTRDRAERNYGGTAFFKAPGPSRQKPIQHQNPEFTKSSPSLDDKKVNVREHARAMLRRAEQAKIARLVANRDKNPLSPQLQAFVNYFNAKIASQDTAYTPSRLAHFKSAFGLHTSLADWKNSVPSDDVVRSWLPAVFTYVLPNTHYGNLVHALTEADFQQLRKEGRFAKLIQTWEAEIRPKLASALVQ